MRSDRRTRSRPAAHTYLISVSYLAPDERPDLAADETLSSDDIAAIAALVRDREVIEVIVGLPINLAGKEGPAAVLTRAYAERLAGVVDPVPVRMADERMSTVTASRRLSERGVRGRRQRAVVDQAAAVEILQGWLDARRAGMRRGGTGAD